MPAPSTARLIHLLAVAKSFPRQGGTPKVVLHPTTVALPADRRVAVLGEKGDGKTVILRMLAGLDAPDQGEIVGAAQMSPIANGGGFLHPQLTAQENIGLLARIYGVDTDQLTVAVETFCGLDDLSGGRLDPALRRMVELAVTAVLPFQCCLVDNLGLIALEVAERYLETATARGAGVIFTANKAWLARRFADYAVVIRDGALHPFTRVEEASSFYARR
jgi:capsular polysaccharide transport system ATP-binding protein